MYFAIIYRTPEGEIVPMKPRFVNLLDAEEQVEYANPWLTDENWIRENGGSHIQLTDGSQFVIYQEA